MAEASQFKERFDQILQNESNTYCVDCRQKLDFSDGLDTPWASINLGIFTCTRCCGSHRGLGTDISKMRSVTYDTKVWGDDVMAVFQNNNNESVNTRLEACLPCYHVHPQELPSNDTLRTWFIPKKYRERAFIDKSLLERQMPQPLLHHKFFAQTAEERSSDAKLVEYFFELSGESLKCFKKAGDSKPLRDYSVFNLSKVEVKIDNADDGGVAIVLNDIYLYNSDFEIIVEWTHALRAASLYYTQLAPRITPPHIAEQVDLTQVLTKLGEASKQSPKSTFFSAWQKRYWVVSSDHVLYYMKPVKEEVTMVTVSGGFPLLDTEVVEMTDRIKKQNCLLLSTPERDYFVALASGEQRSQWVNELTNLIRTLRPLQMVNFSTKNLSLA